MVMDKLTRKDILRLIASGRISPEEGARMFAGGEIERGQAERRKDSIAVIGMAGRFSDARDIRQFWDNLVAGKDSIRPVPLDRWPGYDCFSNDPGIVNKTPCRFGGFLTGIDEFDPLFFNISPMEAELMDPQQRLFLQEAWTALEDAGYCPGELNGVKCGVFVGVTAVDYQDRLEREGVPINATLFTGNSSSILSARISYFLNLKGPAVSIDTACSSSLTAISLACESIRGEMCAMAVAGGVQVLTTPDLLIKTGNSNMLAPDGRCKTFDHRADGFVPGEGAGAVVLKPAQNARDDGDHIYGVITAWGLNQDGKSNGITAPSAPSQTELELEVYKRFGIDPRSISYIETHGTGTKLGDPIEVDALTDAFRAYTTDTRFCALGSVKTNIGHALAAAGVAGFIKVMLCCKHRLFVPSLHFQKANPHIDFESSPFYVNTQLREWRQNSGAVRRAAVSAFGFSGTNAHLVVEAEDALDTEIETGGSGTSPLLIVLSAKNEDRLKVSAANLIRFIDGNRLGTGEAHSAEDEIRLKRLLERELTRLTAEVLDVTGDDLLPDDNLAEYGMDPVVFIELLQKVNKTFNLDVTPPMGNGSTSIGSLGQNLLCDYPERMEEYFAEAGDGEAEVTGFSFHWDDLTYTLQAGREPMEERLAVVAPDLDSALTALKKYTGGAGAGRIPGFHSGNVSEGWAVAELMSAGNDVDEFIRLNIAERNLEKIARLWVSGVTIPWTGLYPARKPKRMPLPGYPFATERYWIPTGYKNKPAGTAPAVHMLLDAVDIDQTGERRIVFKKTFSSGDPVIRDHRVRGVGILPGAGSLAMMQAALAMTVNNGDVCIENLVWQRPLAVESGNKEVFVTVNAALSPVLVSVSSGSGDRRDVYAEGVLGSAGNEASPPSVDIAAIRARCRNHFAREDVLRLAAAMGIEYGPYFKGLREVWACEGEALGVIEMPAAYAAELERCLAHPALVDSALQVILGIFSLDGTASHRAMMPFSVGKVSWRSRLPVSGHVYVRQTGDWRYDVSVLDSGGDWCLQLQDIAFRPVKDTAKANYYLTRWLPVELPNHYAADERVLVVYPDSQPHIESAMKLAVPAALHEYLPFGETGIPVDWQPLNHWLSLDKPVESLYFFALFPSMNVDDIDAAAMRRLQETTLLSLFRLLKALDKEGFLERLSRLVIVTNDVHHLPPTRITIPYAAGLTGFARVLAKEYSSLSVRCVDVHLDPQEGGTLDAALPRAVESGFEETAIRSGIVYRRTVEEVAFPEPKEFPFKRNGVYVIAGGAGGIGFELARFLAEKARARLVLLGRSPFERRMDEMKTQIEALGGEAEYIQTDIANRESLEAAAQTARTRFGHIDGVIHSAIVLKDSTFKHMDETTLLQALEPKTLGSFLLYSVFKRDPLDFMMFFSSGQSFTCNYGQGNYAAGCTFKDAFGLHLGSVASFPVKIVNWGYWGNVGIVAHESYSRRLAAMGIESIEASEGMDAVLRILASPVPQVMFLKAEGRFLQTIGVDRETHWQLVSEVIPSVGSLGPEPGYPPVDADVAGNYGVGFQLMGREIPLLVVRAFQRMGVFLAEGESFRVEELFARVGVVQGYRRLFAELLAILRRAGFLALRGTEFSTTAKMAAQDVKDILARAAEDRDARLQPYPQVQGHTGLLWACADNLAEVLQGRKTHMEVMFPGGSKALVEGVYRGNPVADYFHLLLSRVIRLFVEKRTADAPQEMVRILEIGAGTGGTSRFVLEALAPFGSRVQYVYTDISMGFTRFGRETYGDRYRFVDFQVLNIEEPVQSQGFRPGSFDVVFGSNVLHATRRMEETLLNAKCLLKRNGLLLVNEATENHDFATLTFGLTDGWWRFLDPDIRLEGSPLLGPESWRDLLGRLGFGDIRFFKFPDQAVKEFGQTVIVAASDGLIRLLRSSGRLPERHPVPPPPVPEQILGPEKNSPQETGIGMERYLIGIFAGILKIKPEQIDPRTTFERYGVDSLVGMDVVKRLEQDFGKLPATLLFEYMTVGKLAEYFTDTFPGKLNGEPAQKPQTAVTGANPPARGGDMDGFALSYVRRVFAGILKLPEDKIDAKTTFERFGVDSLVGMDIVKRLSEDFGPLPATLLFEHMTMEKLASFFVTGYRDRLATLGSDNRGDHEEPDGLTGMVERLPEREVDALLELLRSGEI